MEFKCKKCNRYKNKLEFNKAEFEGYVIKKTCFECSIKNIQKEENGKRLKLQLEIKELNDKARLKASKSLNDNASINNQPLMPNKYKTVYMRKGDRNTAYFKRQGKFKQFKNIKCQFTGETKIVVKHIYGGDKWYPIKRMYKYIFGS
tara:strand:- start:165 stop:605 length:441 start_codon:yes stop_codon:yes gene_type:complete